MVLLSSLDERRSLYHVNIGIPLRLGDIYITVFVCIWELLFVIVV